MRNKTTIAAVIAASLLGFGAAAQAYTAIVSVAPPAPRIEVVPAQRHGHVWAPGHYEWRGGQYAWVEGHWLAERRGYEYREPRWVQRGNGEWVLVGGNWEHRADHDRHARGRDWDGDGIPDHRDRFPRNPNRS